MSKEKRAAFALLRIQQALGDDANYPDPVLKLGAIWSLCVRAAEFRCGTSGDGSPFVEVSVRSPTPEMLADRQREPDAVEKQALYGNLRELTRKDAPDVPPGHFWRGVLDRHYCRNCGHHYGQHLHTDEASTCPTANR